MTMPRALLPISTYPDATPEAGLKNGVGMARLLGAGLTTVAHHVVIPKLHNPAAEFLFQVEAMANAAEAQSRSRGQELASSLARFAKEAEVALEVEQLVAEGPIGEAIAARGRAFDVTMLVRHAASPDHALLQEDVLFGAGGPILVLPTEEVEVHLRAVSVAWDGGRAASRAMRDALPLLKRAGAVHLLICFQDKAISQDAIDAALAFLRGHGIEAVPTPFELDGLAIGDAMQAVALAHDAGLLVMGGYGHSRVREFVLGGATAHALRSAKLPILMSH